MGYFDKFNKGPYKGKSFFGKLWHFIWNEDSIESWLINIVLAFVIIKFIVYPGLGLVLGTTHQFCCCFWKHGAQYCETRKSIYYVWKYL
jgi:hypothetical protein